MKKVLKYFNPTYAALFLIIIWEPLRTYIFTDKGSGYIVLFFVVLSIAKEIFRKSLWRHLFKAPYLFWLIWIIYALVNTFYINTYMAELAPATFIFSLFLPLYIMLVIANERYNISELTNLFIWAFFFRIILSLLFDSFDARYIVVRLGETFNANNIAIGGVCLIVCVGFKKYLTNKINVINYVQVIVALYIIGLTASRSAAITLAISIICLIYIERSKNLLKRYVSYSIFALIVSVIFSYMLIYTGIGQRIVDIYESTMYAHRIETMLDNRMWHYTLGIELFKSNPLTGIGLTNFMLFHPHKVMAHSEYVVQLAECGIIGIIIWISFFGTIIYNLFKVHNMTNGNAPPSGNRFLVSAQRAD